MAKKRLTEEELSLGRAEKKNTNEQEKRQNSFQLLVGNGYKLRKL